VRDAPFALHGRVRTMHDAGSENSAQPQAMGSSSSSIEAASDKGPGVLRGY
jgi:hypothetical protein